MNTIRVLFNDGAFIDVNNVMDWHIDNDFNMFFIVKETHNVMIPRENVRAIGRLEDFSVL